MNYVRISESSMFKINIRRVNTHVIYLDCHCTHCTVCNLWPFIKPSRWRGVTVTRYISSLFDFLSSLFGKFIEIKRICLIRLFFIIFNPGIILLLFKRFSFVYFFLARTCCSFCDKRYLRLKFS